MLAYEMCGRSLALSSNESSPSTDIMASSSISNDNSKIFRLKSENVDRFTDVVMMHLSFLMDLSGQKFEEIMEVTHRGKPGLFSSIIKNTRENIFGSRPSLQSIGRIFPLINFLGITENCQREGIFRLSGVMDRQRELKESIERNEHLNFMNSRFTVNDVATVFKNYLSDLPEPLLLDKHFNAYKQISVMRDENKQIECLQLLNQLLPNENAILLRNLLILLNKVASLQHFNKMNSNNLSIIFTPHLFIPKKIPLMQLKEATDNLKGLVVLMVNNSSIMFDYPTNWVKDAVKYSDDVVQYSGTSQKRSMSRTPFKIFTKSAGDEDMDDVVLTTHISFTDRQASLEASQSINTEKALSDLYAYVQTLPESGNKKKLLKRFDSPITPVSCKENNLSLNLKKSICKRNIFAGKRFLKLFDDEDVENFDPAIICNSILLSDNEEI